MDKRNIKKSTNFLLFGAVLASIWATLEHFNISISCLLLRQEITNSCWVQDVQNRVFGTFGQPNWLAAYLVALSPIAWASAIYNLSFYAKATKDRQFSKLQFLNLKAIINLLIPVLFFICILFTKSRSGILAFGVSFVVFWAIVLLYKQAKTLKIFAITTSCLLVTTLLIGTPWTPTVHQLVSSSVDKSSSTTESNKLVTDNKGGTALETGGTDSGSIRKIVWKGAIEIWKHYPLFGTGVETFAFSYFNFRPIEHNQVSEWEFTYNKAHNEYLNYLATTGTLGFAAYIVLILAMLFITLKNLRFTIYDSRARSSKSNLINHAAILTGFISILITNFFGFSVTTTSLLFFLLPAFAVSLQNSKLKTEDLKIDLLNINQKLGLFFVLSIMSLVVFSVGKYWYADTLYAKGQNFNSNGDYKNAFKKLTEAVKISPNESVYWIELAEASKYLAEEESEKSNKELAFKLADQAVKSAETASDLSPKNVNIKRLKYAYYSDLSIIDVNFLLAAEEEIIDAIPLAPTDPRLYYLSGINKLKLKQNESAVTELKRAIELKPNFTNARYTLALIYIDQGKLEEAKKELNYILENIDPNNKLVREELKNL